VPLLPDPGAAGRLGKETTLTEHLPEETMAIVASDADPADLPDELIDELLAGARTPGRSPARTGCCSG
jgi:hypothetical protein